MKIKLCIFITLVFGLIHPFVSADEWKPAGDRIMTRWAKDVSPKNAWPEYPRPQMVREQWLNLNGLWDYAIIGESGEWKKGRLENATDSLLNDLDESATPQDWDGKILVPYCVESALSGVAEIVRPDQVLWYRRDFQIPKAWRGQRVLLHFDAVDWHAVVIVNGKKIGEHKGGYAPFTFDVTNALKGKGKQGLTLAVWDPTNMGDQAVGKQSLPEARKGFRYTPTTGIWQTVWLEPVPGVSIKGLKAVPDIDREQLTVSVELQGSPEGLVAELQALDSGRVVGIASGAPGEAIRLKIKQPKLWSPDSPFLYDLKVVLKRGEKTLDTVKSYFGMRKISLGKDERGIPRLMLNNKVIFQYGTLDQGYWPDGVLTPASDAAALYDVEYLRSIGLNMNRVHVTVQPERWYYHADRAGLLVWQDMVCTRKFESKITPESAAQWELEQKRMIDSFGNHPSIVMWIVFNEGWGQYDTERLTAWTKQYDPSRLVNAASGWTDKAVGDTYDIHDYSFHSAIPMPFYNGGRAVVLGEVGGIDVPIKGHLWHLDQPVKLIRDAVGESGREKYTSAEEWTENYGPWLEGIRTLIDYHGLCAAVYTQIADVEHEPNGFLTYDREVSKIDVATLKKWHDRLYSDAPSTRVILPASKKKPQTWKYLTADPGKNWFAEDYNDSAWKSGKAPFGTRAKNIPKITTEWKTGSIWMRRRFNLDTVPEKVSVRAFSLGGLEVFINGKRVKSLLSKARSFYVSAGDGLLRDDLASALRKGENTIAVRGFGKGVEKYIDLGLVEVLP